MNIRFLTVATGSSVALLACVLLILGEHSDFGRYGLTLGVGIVASALLPANSPVTHRFSRWCGFALVAGFVGLTIGFLWAGSKAVAPSAVALAVETVSLVFVLVVVRSYLFGFGRLMALLAQPSDVGYARVLELGDATVVLDAELARSRRRTEPLVALAISPCWRGDLLNSTTDGYERSRSARYFEEMYTRAQLGRLLSEYARRSDFVVRASKGVYFVFGTCTDGPGAHALADRLTRIACADLGIDLEIGVATFPSDGETVRELMDVGLRRAGSENAQPERRLPARSVNLTATATTP